MDAHYAEMEKEEVLLFGLIDPMLPEKINTKIYPYFILVFLSTPTFNDYVLILISVFY